MSETDSEAITRPAVEPEHTTRPEPDGDTEQRSLSDVMMNPYVVGSMFLAADQAIDAVKANIANRPEGKPEQPPEE